MARPEVWLEEKPATEARLIGRVMTTEVRPIGRDMTKEVRLIGRAISKEEARLGGNMASFQTWTAYAIKATWGGSDLALLSDDPDCSGSCSYCRGSRRAMIMHGPARGLYHDQHYDARFCH